MRKILRIFELTVLSVLCLSCQGLEFCSWTGGKDIRVSVSGGATTKAASEALSCDAEIVAEKDGFTIVEYVSDMDDILFGADTKGLITTSGNINVSGRSFVVDAYLGEDILSAADAEDTDRANCHFISGRSVTYNGSSWNWDGEAPEWRNNIPTTFWSYYPVSVAGRIISLPSGDTPSDAGQSGISFSYTLPAPAVSAPFDDARGQQDLMFAYNNETCGFDSNGSISSRSSSNPEYLRSDNQVDIHFFHALAAVKFDITGVFNDLTVENISLRNVASSAECAVTAPLTIDSFVWDSHSTLKSYSQDFSSSDDFETRGSRKTQKTTGDKVFFMIPQTLGSTAELCVTFRFKDSSTRTLSASISGNEWLPGRYYTYALKKTSGEVSIDLFCEDGTPMTAAADAHFGNAMLRLGKTVPASVQLEITKPDGTVTALPSDAAWLRFARPTGTTAFASYPGSSSTVGISDLISEITGTGAKPHLLEDGDYYYTQVFIDEYYYESQLLSSFVGRGNRSVTISLSNASSSSSATISQKAMQSPYNLSAANPFGVEVIEEGTVSTGTNSSSWCLSRNRDEDGNGTVEGAEIKWRAPNLQEYWNIWYGTYSMSAESWLGLSTSPARELYFSSDDGLAYNGRLGTTVTGASGTGTVRCIRDLGAGPNSMFSLAEVPGVIDNGDAEKKYVITMNGVSDASMRSRISGRELTSGAIAPGEGTDCADNKLYSSIQVASQYLTWPTGTTVKVPVLLYYLAVEKDRAKSIDDYHFAVEYDSKGNITLIEGQVKMINPDPRLVYESSFNGGHGGVSPSYEWSYLDKNGVLHFHTEFTGWSAANSEVSWVINAAIDNGNGTTSDLSGGNTCSLIFYSGKISDLSGGWGVEYKSTTLIGDTYTALPSSGKCCRLGIQDGGPYTLYDVEFPGKSEEFEGTTTKVDDKQYSEFLCRNYYYEDRRTRNGSPVKGDLGTWRAPNQRELSIMLANRPELKITKATESGSGEYVWSEVDWLLTDKVSTPSITSSISHATFYNYNGALSTGGTAPYRIRCVRDL